MKEIQPVSIWYNGEMVIATLFDMNSTYDNLIDTAFFSYSLYVNDNLKVVSGNISMTDADYIAYSTSTTANEYAYQWGATQLNLTLV